MDGQISTQQISSLQSKLYHPTPMRHMVHEHLSANVSSYERQALALATNRLVTQDRNSQVQVSMTHSTHHIGIQLGSYTFYTNSAGNLRRQEMLVSTSPSMFVNTKDVSSMKELKVLQQKMLGLAYPFNDFLLDSVTVFELEFTEYVGHRMRVRLVMDQHVKTWMNLLETMFDNSECLTYDTCTHCRDPPVVTILIQEDTFVQAVSYANANLRYENEDAWFTEHRSALVPETVGTSSCVNSTHAKQEDLTSSVGRTAGRDDTATSQCISGHMGTANHTASDSSQEQTRPRRRLTQNYASSSIVQARQQAWPEDVPVSSGIPAPVVHIVSAQVARPAVDPQAEATSRDPLLFLGCDPKTEIDGIKAPNFGCLTCVRYGRKCSGTKVKKGKCDNCRGLGSSKGARSRTCYWPQAEKGVCTYNEARLVHGGRFIEANTAQARKRKLAEIDTGHEDGLSEEY